jgi:hypothetical protein
MRPEACVATIAVAASRGSILCLLTLRGHRSWNARRAGIGNWQNSRLVACFSSMHIIDRFTNGLPLMDDRGLSTGPIVQREGSGEDVYRIRNGMIVPRQRGLCCNGHLKSCELRLAGRVARIAFTIPRLRCLQQSLTLVVALRTVRQTQAKKGNRGALAVTRIRSLRLGRAPD